MFTKNSLFLFHLHPLFIVTTAFIVGIVLQSYAFNTFLVPTACITLLFALVCIKKTFWHPLFLAILLASAAGALVYQRQVDHYTNFYHQTQRHSYTLTGTITDIQQAASQRYKYTATITNSFLVAHDDSSSITPHASLMIYSNDLKAFQVGDTITISPLSFKQPKNISFMYYLMKQGVIATVFLTAANKLELATRPFYSLNRWLFNKKMQIFALLKSKISFKTFSFFAPLFLGFKQRSKHQDQLKQHFKLWGLSHYLARSGLHLIVFIALWRLFLNCIPLSFILKQIIIILLSLIYFLLTWSSISFIRAFLAFSMYCILLIWNQQINGMHILTLITLLILITNPTQLFFLDFQLSFSLTLALLWFSNIQFYAFRQTTIK